MAASAFRELLLRVMDQKDHWGWYQITSPGLKKNQLQIHFQQEWEVYVRDFPILLARILGRMNEASPELKREFAENIYEEQTGGLSAKISKNLSHPELFLKMMRGLGYQEREFSKVELLPTSLAYRSYIDLVTLTGPWQVGAVVLGLFVEGSREDRARLKQGYRPTQNLNAKIRNHSLHKFYGLKESNMDLIKAHHAIEGAHRKSAWDTLLKEIPKHLEDEIVTAMRNSLELWLLYRDGICLEMGLRNASYERLVNSVI